MMNNFFNKIRTWFGHQNKPQLPELHESFTELTGAKDVKLLIGERGCGRTTAAIKLSAETGATIVVFQPHHVFGIEGMAKRMGLKIPKPVTFERLQTVGQHKIQEIIIDDIGLIAERLFNPFQIICITINAKE